MVFICFYSKCIERTHYISLKEMFEKTNDNRLRTNVIDDEIVSSIKT